MITAAVGAAVPAADGSPLLLLFTMTSSIAAEAGGPAVSWRKCWKAVKLKERGLCRLVGLTSNRILTDR